VSFEAEGRNKGVREILGFKNLFDELIAKGLQGIFDVPGSIFGLHLTLVIMNLDGKGGFAVEGGIKAGGDLHGGADFLVRDLVFPVVSIGHDFQVLASMQSRNQLG